MDIPLLCDRLPEGTSEVKMGVVEMPSEVKERLKQQAFAPKMDENLVEN